MPGTVCHRARRASRPDRVRRGPLAAVALAALALAAAAPAGAALERAAIARPAVKTYAPGGVHLPGSTVRLAYSVDDPSGRARAYPGLYQGGAAVATSRPGFRAATGARRTWTVRLGAKLLGPVYFCLWAESPTGTRSRGAPLSSCAHVSVKVRWQDRKKISNGCGGKAWDAVLAVENYFGNSGVFYQPEVRRRDGSIKVPRAFWTVWFTTACDFHDAGYRGATIEDPSTGGVRDYHDWSRRRIDDRFLADMRRLCSQQIDPSAKTALRDCKNNYRYDVVRTFGSLFFDADLRRRGTQVSGHRTNN